jgi:hypothetical protein
MLSKVIKVNSKTISKMDKENISFQKTHILKDFGKMINKYKVL